MEKTSVTLTDIQEAAKRIGPYIRHTPLLRQAKMDAKMGCQVYVKPEMLQITGAFKLRGALSKILSLSPEERQKGIVTSSSGNHAQACAYAGQLFGIPATVVIPEDAPAIKIANAKAMGAKVIVEKRNYDIRWERVRQEVAERGCHIVHAFEDYTVMAGQGTIALEIMEDLPDVDTIVAPIGGGGLISGISTAVKESNPRIRVIGVQAAASAGYVASRQAGKRVKVDPRPTIADGITCAKPTDHPYPIIERYVDELVAVSEESILEALKLIAQEAKLVAEPTSSVVAAALLSGQIKTRPDEKVCLVLTSGNWDLRSLGKVFLDQPVPGVM